LNAIAQSKLEKPWVLSFCYGRAIQGPTLQEWGGKRENVKKAQKMLLHRSKANGLAQLGEYCDEEQVAKEIGKLGIV
jgi:fructose-bisphosphate aldolase class I